MNTVARLLEIALEDFAQEYKSYKLFDSRQIDPKWVKSTDNSLVADNIWIWFITTDNIYAFLVIFGFFVVEIDLI